MGKARGKKAQEPAIEDAELEKDQARVPDVLMDKIGSFGFVKWTSAYCPVLIVDPMELIRRKVLPEGIYHAWMYRIDLSLEDDRANKVPALIYWYGTTYEFSVVALEDVIPFKRGQELGYHEIPEFMKRRLDMELSVPAVYQLVKDGMEELETTSAKLPPSERSSHIVSPKRKRQVVLNEWHSLSMEDLEPEQILWQERHAKLLKRGLPNSKLFGTIGFLPFGKGDQNTPSKPQILNGFKHYHPVMILSPFKVAPGQVRSEWFLKCSSKQQVLVYWFGAYICGRPQSAYSFPNLSQIISWEDGVKAGYDQLPAKIVEEYNNTAGKDRPARTTKTKKGKKGKKKEKEDPAEAKANKLAQMAEWLVCGHWEMRHTMERPLNDRWGGIEDFEETCVEDDFDYYEECLEAGEIAIAARLEKEKLQKHQQSQQPPMQQETKKREKQSKKQQQPNKPKEKKAKQPKQEPPAATEKSKSSNFSSPKDQTNTATPPRLMPLPQPHKPKRKSSIPRRNSSPSEPHDQHPKKAEDNPFSSPSSIGLGHDKKKKAKIDAIKKESKGNTVNTISSSAGGDGGSSNLLLNTFKSKRRPEGGGVKPHTHKIVSHENGFVDKGRRKSLKPTKKRVRGSSGNVDVIISTFGGKQIITKKRKRSIDSNSSTSSEENAKKSKRKSGDKSQSKRSKKDRNSNSSNGSTTETEDLNSETVMASFRIPRKSDKSHQEQPNKKRERDESSNMTKPEMVSIPTTKSSVSEGLEAGKKKTGAMNDSSNPGNPPRSNGVEVVDKTAASLRQREQDNGIFDDAEEHAGSSDLVTNSGAKTKEGLIGTRKPFSTPVGREDQHGIFDDASEGGPSPPTGTTKMEAPASIKPAMTNGDNTLKKSKESIHAGLPDTLFSSTSVTPRDKSTTSALRITAPSVTVKKGDISLRQHLANANYSLDNIGLSPFKVSSVTNADTSFDSKEGDTSLVDDVQNSLLCCAAALQGGDESVKPEDPSMRKEGSQ